MRHSLEWRGAELKRQGQAALSGSKTKAPGSAGGYLLSSRVRRFSVAVAVAPAIGKLTGVAFIRVGAEFASQIVLSQALVHRAATEQ